MTTTWFCGNRSLRFSCAYVLLPPTEYLYKLHFRRLCATYNVPPNDIWLAPTPLSVQLRCLVKLLYICLSRYWNSFTQFLIIPAVGYTDPWRLRVYCHFNRIPCTNFEIILFNFGSNFLFFRWGHSWASVDKSCKQREFWGLKEKSNFRHYLRYTWACTRVLVRTNTAAGCEGFTTVSLRIQAVLFFKPRNPWRLCRIPEHQDPQIFASSESI